MERESAAVAIERVAVRWPSGTTEEFQGDNVTQELLDRVYGGTVKLQETYLRPASKRDILVRLLANLKTIYLNTRDDERALAAVERILLIRPDSAEEVRDHGMILARRGKIEQAIAELEHYLDVAPSAADAQRVRLLIEELVKGNSQ